MLPLTKRTINLNILKEITLICGMIFYEYFKIYNTFTFQIQTINKLFTDLTK